MTRKQFFGEAYAKGFCRTVGFLRKYGANNEDALEFAQRGWVRGWEQLWRLKDERLVVEFVNAIALNLMRDAFRRERRTQRLAHDYELVGSSEINLEVLDLRRARQCLNAHQNLVLQLVYEGSTCAEVARRLDTTTEAIWAELSRTRNILRKKMTVARPTAKERQDSAA
jgi:RNA polymerase sigma factor (sigma-70 family)